MIVVVDCIPSGGRPIYDKRIDGTVQVVDEVDGKFDAVETGHGAARVLVPLFGQTREMTSVMTEVIEEYAIEESNIVIVLQDDKIGLLIHNGNAI